MMAGSGYDTASATWHMNINSVIVTLYNFYFYIIVRGRFMVGVGVNFFFYIYNLKQKNVNLLLASGLSCIPSSHVWSSR